MPCRIGWALTFLLLPTLALLWVRLLLLLLQLLLLPQVVEPLSPSLASPPPRWPDGIWL